MQDYGPLSNFHACCILSVPSRSTSKTAMPLLASRHVSPHIGHITNLLAEIPSLKMDGWKTSLSFWGTAHFQGLLLLVSGRVNKKILDELPFGLASPDVMFNLKLALQPLCCCRNCKKCTFQQSENRFPVNKPG